MASRTWIWLILFSGASPAWPGDLFEGWKLEMEVGYLRPVGRIHDTFDRGVSAGFAVGRRIFSDVVAEGGVRLGDMGFSATETVTTRECVRTQGQVLCVTGPATQRGSFNAFALGLSVPARVDSRGRLLQLGAGVLFGRYSISPGGNQLGARSGPGFYVKLAGDLLPIGTAGSVGLLLRGARVSTRGDSFGTSLPSKTSDTWIAVNVLLRLGPRASRRP